MYENTEGATLLIKTNDRVAISSRLTSSRMRSINYACDTGAGPDMLQKDLVEPYLLPLIRLHNSPRRGRAANQKVNVFGTSVLHGKMG